MNEPTATAVAAGLRRALLWASEHPSLGRAAQRAPGTRKVVQRFVAGEDLPAALTAIATLRSSGFGTTVDVLGESVTAAEDAERARVEYQAVITGLLLGGHDLNISVKLTQLGLELGHDSCRTNLMGLVDSAQAAGAFIRIDMEDSSKVDATLALAREARRTYESIGVVVQAYLRRSLSDVESLIRDGVRVRLCKGAYAESRAVAFQSNTEVDESYVRMMERLLTNGDYPAIATHDPRLVARTRDYAERIGRPKSSFEFQMLFGVRRDLQTDLARAGYKVRIYVPFGPSWYPYFMRRLAERPANLAFFWRTLWGEAGG